VRDGLELARERPRQGRTRDVLDALCDLAEAPLHWCAGDVHTALSLLEGLEEEQSEGASRAMMVRTLAAVYASADRIEEIPALRAGFGCPVLLFRIWSPDAYAFLAMGEPEAALDEIDDLKAIAHLPDYLRCPPAELVVEALLALERVDEAAELVAAAAGSDHPSQLLMEARLARARGEDGRSAARAFEAAAQFRELGNVLNAWRAERLRAESLLAAGHVSEAEPVLRRVIAEALPGGEKLQARLAAEALTAAGLDPVADVSTPEAPVPLGERMVSVLFADVRGYTQLAGDTAPADLSSKMGAFHRWSRREIERQRGVVDKFAGDAVMATFNVAGNQVDHAESALQAAIALSDKAALLGLGVGVGIATGPAVVGQLTAGANLSVLGTTTNLAARLQTEAQGGEIVLDEEAHRRIRSDVDASRELLQVKGFKQPVPGYRIRRRLGAPAPVPSARPESNGSGGVKPARLGPLSRRESEVAMLVAQGLTNRQIAERLHISERTAEGHLDKIRSKLGLSNRAQVAAWVTER
jgi:adenylate cyclase